MAVEFREALQTLISQFILDWEVKPVVGAEIEFYLLPKGTESSPEALNKEHRPAIEAMLKGAGIALYDVSQERGDFQLEIALAAHENPLQLIDAIYKVQRMVSDYAEKHQLNARFDAKPFSDQPGNGLHINVSLHDLKGTPLFHKKDEKMSEWLNFSIGGLLHIMEESMVVFAPYSAAYYRFSPDKHDAPVNICWGANNRTTALRLPASLDGVKHIEHRVPCADANPTSTVMAILAGVHYGISRRIAAPPQIHGNAFDASYGLTPLPSSLRLAEAAFARGEVLQEYFGDNWVKLLQEVHSREANDQNNPL